MCVELKGLHVVGTERVVLWVVRMVSQLSGAGKWH
jgi:hypothetical protein